MRRRASDGGRADWRMGGWGAAALLTWLSAYPPIRLSAQQVNNSGALFLVFPVGARAVGMGQTAAALDGRGEATFWNPAGLATLEKNEFGLQSATLVAGNTDALTAYFPSHRVGVLGGAIYLVDYGDLDRTDATGNTIGRIAPRNLEFVASYATGIAGAFSFGVNYKLVQFVVDCSGDCTNIPSAKGTTHAVDVGGQVAAGPEGALRLGVAVRNIGFKLQVNNGDQADALPARLLIGALYRIVLPAGRGDGPGERFDLKVAADVDSPWGSYGGAQMRVGRDVGHPRPVRAGGGYASPPPRVQPPPRCSPRPHAGRSTGCAPSRRCSCPGRDTCWRTRIAAPSTSRRS